LLFGYWGIFCSQGVTLILSWRFIVLCSRHLQIMNIWLLWMEKLADLLIMPVSETMVNVDNISYIYFFLITIFSNIQCMIQSSWKSPLVFPNSLEMHSLTDSRSVVAELVFFYRISYHSIDLFLKINIFPTLTFFCLGIDIIMLLVSNNNPMCVSWPDCKECIGEQWGL